MDNEEDQRDQFADDGGDALRFDDNDMQESEDNMEEDMIRGSSDQKKEGSSAGAPGPGGKVAGEKLDNQPYDLAVDVNDSEEIESDEEDDEVNPIGGVPPGQSAQQA